jgi:predicted transcriptional regulator
MRYKYNEYKKTWSQANKSIINLNKKRSELKTNLIDVGILPKTYPYTKNQEELMDKLKSNDFDDILSLLKEKNKEVRKNKSIERKKIIKIKKQTEKVDKNKRKIEVRLNKMVDAGILPKDYHNLETEQHKVIYDLAVNHLTLPPQKIIWEYINDANLLTKQKYVHTKLKTKVSRDYYKKKGKFMDIKPEDIIINEYCPFLGIKIDYNTHSKEFFNNDSQSVDRIENSKGYVKNNVWVISRLANTMKNDATTEQLKTFCKNIILMYAK